MGDRVPKPPKDVPILPDEAEGEGGLSVRQLTERHSQDVRCAGCHAKMDPYGFSLEAYDAVVLASFGGPEVLRIADVDVPAPGPDEILVRVAGAGVNQLDTKIRAGAMPQGRPPAFPLGTGVDAAGAVTAVGPGVTAWPSATSSSAPAEPPWPNRRS